jgi:hypothetical protein
VCLVTRKPILLSIFATKVVDKVSNMAEDLELILTFMRKVRDGEYVEVANVPEEFIRVETLEYLRPAKEEHHLIGYGMA